MACSLAPADGKSSPTEKSNAPALPRAVYKRRQPDIGMDDMHNILRHIRRAALRQAGEGLTDGQLLECFVTRRDEAAFEALVRRHGPMVLGVCRRVLRHEQD